MLPKQVVFTVTKVFGITYIFHIPDLFELWSSFPMVNQSLGAYATENTFWELTVCYFCDIIACIWVTRNAEWLMLMLPV